MGALTAVASQVPTSLQLSESELIDVLGNSIYPGAKNESIKLAIGYCRAQGLDPLQKPVHIVPMRVKVPGTRDDYEWRDVIMPGVGLYRTQASRTNACAGISEPEFGPEKELTVGDTKVAYPDWCRVTVRRLVNGVACDFTAVEYWTENYATAGKDTRLPNAMWRKRPRGQIAKCAEAQALRKAFPEIGAAPTAEELEGKTLGDEGAGVTIDGATGEVISTGVKMPRAREDAAAAQPPAAEQPAASHAGASVAPVTTGTSTAHAEKASSGLLNMIRGLAKSKGVGDAELATMAGGALESLNKADAAALMGRVKALEVANAA